MKVIQRMRRIADGSAVSSELAFERVRSASPLSALFVSGYSTEMSRAVSVAKGRGEGRHSRRVRTL
ncbi:MAG: hypothetical protein ACM3ZE_27715, partial [Myxococcales bacterium]